MNYADYKDDLDGFYFILDEDNKILFETFKYTNPGEVFGTELGDIHHIILYREDEYDKPDKTERFEALLVDPVTYAKEMLKAGYYGMISKKTTTSEAWADATMNMLLSIQKEAHTLDTVVQ